MSKEKYTTPKEALQALKELEETNKMENLVRDNKIIFTVKDKKYRLRIPTLEEQEDISNEKRKKRLEYLNDPSYLPREEWIKKYKVKGIDIDAMEDDVRKLQAEIKNSLLKLATTSGKEAVEAVKKEVNDLKDKQIQESIKITDYLSDCLESQLKIFVDSYTAYLVLEKKQEKAEEGEKEWEKVFKDYDEFNKCDDVELISATFYFYDALIYSGV